MAKIQNMCSQILVNMSLVAPLYSDVHWASLSNCSPSSVEALSYRAVCFWWHRWSHHFNHLYGFFKLHEIGLIAKLKLNCLIRSIYEKKCWLLWSFRYLHWCIPYCSAGFSECGPCLWLGLPLMILHISVCTQPFIFSFHFFKSNTLFVHILLLLLLIL